MTVANFCVLIASIYLSRFVSPAGALSMAVYWLVAAVVALVYEMPAK